jgi:hypothetical protein
VAKHRPVWTHTVRISLLQVSSEPRAATAPNTKFTLGALSRAGRRRLRLIYRLVRGGGQPFARLSPGSRAVVNF